MGNGVFCVAQSAWVLHVTMACDDFAIKKNLVSLAVGKALLDIDSRRYSEVANLLGTKYAIELSDCYEHPNFLRDALKELYGNSYRFMVDSIRQNLSGFPDHVKIARFLSELSE